MNKEKSIAAQKKAGTWSRNERIRADSRTLAVIGQEEGICKTRVWQIKRQLGSNHTNKRSFWKRLKEWLRRPLDGQYFQCPACGGNDAIHLLLNKNWAVCRNCKYTFYVGQGK